MRREKDSPRLQQRHLLPELSPERKQQQKYPSHTNYCDGDVITTKRMIPPPAEESPTIYWKDPDLKL